MRNESRSSALRLRELLADVGELLALFHREEALRAAGDPTQPKPAVHNTLPDLRDRLSRMHSADVAQLLELLPHEDRLLLWRQLREQRGGELLVALGDAVRVALIDALAEEELRLAIGQLASDALAAIAAQIPPRLLQERLRALPDEERRWLERARSYRKGSVGARMSRQMVVVPAHLTLEQALAALRARNELPSPADALYVVDSHGVLCGAVPLPTLLLSAPTLLVSDVMSRDLLTFTPEEAVSDAVQAFERYRLLAAPVVDRHGSVLGRLTVEAVLEHAREERAAAQLNPAGLRGEEARFASLWQRVRNRWPGVAINLLGALLASRVIGLFEVSLAQLVVLAVLMPIVTSLGSNTARQTSALMNHTLARPYTGDSLGLLRSQLGVSLFQGVVLGALVASFTYAIYGHAQLAAVLAAAILLNLLVAALVGSVVPLLLARLGRAPAPGSAVLLTAITDILGFFIFLALATLFLR